MKFAIILLFFISLNVRALTDEKTYLKSIKKSRDFLMWLEVHKDEFAKCVPEKNEDVMRLCDGTEINIKEIQRLFKLKPTDLVAFIKNEKINLEIMCKDDRGTTFKTWCSANQDRKFFKEVSSLHGQYIPNENTIAITSDSNFGSLIHEYIHYKQYQNRNKVYDHAYKRERIEIQNEVVSSFDSLIADIQVLEKQKRIDKAKSLIKFASEFSSILMKFGFWQKLIDERNIFLLYIKHAKELGIAEEDISLAAKNMVFLCNDKELKTIMNKNECP